MWRSRCGWGRRPWHTPVDKLGLPACSTTTWDAMSSKHPAARVSATRGWHAGQLFIGGREGGGGGLGPKSLRTKRAPVQIFPIANSFDPTMVMLVWGGGGEFWDTPPPWVFITLKTPQWHASVEVGNWVDRLVSLMGERQTR